ncbi:MAG: glycosyltransferase, partial [Caulobacterales bacterium]
MRGKIFFWVDHTGRYDGNSGVQRVVRNLSRAMLERGCNVVFVSWSPTEFAIVRSDDASILNLGRFHGPQVPPQERAGEPLHLNEVDEGDLAGAWLIVPEVTHGSPDQTQDWIAYARAHQMRTCVIFHDLIPILQDGYGELRDLHARYAQQLALVDLVIPVSEYAGDTLRTYYARDMRLPYSELPEIVAALNGESFAGHDRPLLAELPERPIQIASLGTIEPRKNQVGVVRAFNRLCHRRPDLDLRLSFVGHLHPAVAVEFKKLVASNPRVEWLGYISDQTLTELYERTHFTIFASVEEGYGLPLAESLWFGRPAICADFGPMAEIAASGGCLTIDTRSDDALEKALERMAIDEDLRKSLAQEAKARKFRTWDNHAEEILLRMENHPAFRRVYYWVDQTCLEPSNSGVQRVTRVLGRALQELGVDVCFVRWSHERDDFQPLSISEAEHLGKWNGPNVEDRTIPAPVPGDWLIVPEIIVPPSVSAGHIISLCKARGMRTAFVFHDLLPLKLSDKWTEHRAAPAIYNSDVANAYEAYWREMAAADAILPNSQSSCDDLSAYLGQNLRKQNNLEKRLRPVLLGVDFGGKGRESVPRVTTGGVRDRIEILSVATIEPRKNLVRLVEAVKRVSLMPGGPKIHLNIAGTPDRFPDLVREINRQIEEGAPATILGHVDDEMLSDLYRSSDFVAYSSYAEGFGLPIIEANWHGKPCLCHNDGAIKEVASGGGCLQVDMLEVDSIVGGLLQLAVDSGLREQLTLEARARPVKSWKQYSIEALQELERISPRPTL